MFLHEPRRDNESKYCILWCHRNAPNLQINWSHRITNKTLEDFIILASSGSLRIQILRPKKKKSWAQTFQFFCFRNHKKSLFYQRQKKLFSLPVWHTTELLLSLPTFSLPLSPPLPPHTHTGRNTWAGSLRRHCHLVDSRPWSKKYLKHRYLPWELMKIKNCHFS